MVELVAGDTDWFAPMVRDTPAGCLISLHVPVKLVLAAVSGSYPCRLLLPARSVDLGLLGGIGSSLVAGPLAGKLELVAGPG